MKLKLYHKNPKTCMIEPPARLILVYLTFTYFSARLPFGINTNAQVVGGAKGYLLPLKENIHHKSKHICRLDVKSSSDQINLVKILPGNVASYPYRLVLSLIHVALFLIFEHFGNQVIYVVLCKPNASASGVPLEKLIDFAAVHAL